MSQDFSERLASILKQSTISIADIAVGNAKGLQWSMQHTSQAASSIVQQRFEPAMQLKHRRYLVASITKPIVAMLAVQAAADGKLSLNDTVGTHLDGFHRGTMRNITIRHLLTHTSGWPDMLPNNNELRAQHATLDEFVVQTRLISPDFVPGSDCRYCSMGIAVLAAILAKTEGRSVAEQLASEVFGPVGMEESWLGLPRHQADQLLPTTVPCELPIWQATDAADWNWNSLYWRSLGAPWGGMISTVSDLGLLATSMLQSASETARDAVFSPSVVNECLSNQTQHFAGLSERDRFVRPWGYGWRFNWKDHTTSFGDFVPSTAIGHWGATGTVMWIDQNSRRWFVMLTNQPWEQSQSTIQRVSNVVASRSLQTSC